MWLHGRQNRESVTEAAHRRALRDSLPTVPVLLAAGLLCHAPFSLRHPQSPCEDGEQMVNPRFKALRRHVRVLFAATQRVVPQATA